MACESPKSPITSNSEDNGGTNFSPTTPNFIRKFQSNFRPLDLCKLSSVLPLNQENSIDRVADQNSECNSPKTQKSIPSSTGSSLNSTPRIRHFASCYHQRGAPKDGGGLRRQCSQIRFKDALLSSLFSPRTKEIEFSVPQTLSPLTPTLGRKVGQSSTESSPGSHSMSDHSRAPSPVFFRSSIGSEGSNLGSINPELYKNLDIKKSKSMETYDDDSEEEEINHGPEVPGIEENKIQQRFGRTWFSLEYKMAEERLVVTVTKAKYLFLKLKPQPYFSTPMRTDLSTSNSMNIIQNICNPCVRVSLLPDERRTQQSTIKLGTANPVFDEEFGFQISKYEIKERSIKISFFHVDQRCNKYTLLGYVVQPLKEYDTTALMKQDFKLDLVREVSDLSPCIGEILVSLCYNRDISRLTVTVVEARGIKQKVSASGLYAKVQLSQNAKIMKTKKTSTTDFFGCRSNFNESFNFKIQEELLNFASVSIQIMYSLSGYNKDQSAGRICLGSFMFARGKGFDHWNEMISKQKQQIQYWHPIAE